MPFMPVKKTLPSMIAENIMNSHVAVRKVEEELRRPVPSQEEARSRCLSGVNSEFFDLVEGHLNTIQQSVDEGVEQTLKAAEQASPNLSEAVENSAPEKTAPEELRKNYALGASSFTYTAASTSPYSQAFGNALNNVSEGMAEAGRRQEAMAERMPPKAKGNIFSGLKNIKKFAANMRERAVSAGNLVRDTMFKVSLRATTMLQSPNAGRVKTAVLGFGMASMALTGLHHMIGPMAHHAASLHASGITDVALASPPTPSAIDTTFHNMGVKAFGADNFTLASAKANILSSQAADGLHDSITRMFSGGQYLSTAHNMFPLKASDALAHSVLHATPSPDLHYASLHASGVDTDLSQVVPQDIHLATPSPVHAASVAPQDVHLATPSPVNAAKVAPQDVHLATPDTVTLRQPAPQDVRLATPDVVTLRQPAPQDVRLATPDVVTLRQPTPEHIAGTPHVEPVSAPVTPAAAPTTHSAPETHPVAHGVSGHHPSHHAAHHAVHSGHHHTGHAVSHDDAEQRVMTEKLNTLSGNVAEGGIDTLHVNADGSTRAATVPEMMSELKAKDPVGYGHFVESHPGFEQALSKAYAPSPEHAQASVAVHTAHPASLETHDDAVKNMHTLAKSDENGISGHANVNGKEVSGEKDFNMHFVGKGIRTVESGVDQATQAVGKGLNKAADFLGL